MAKYCSYILLIPVMSDEHKEITKPNWYGRHFSRFMGNSTFHSYSILYV